MSFRARQEDAVQKNCMVAFFVPGKPLAFARTRQSAAGKFFTPSAQRNYARVVRAAARKVDGVKMLGGPLRLTVRATFEHPASWPKKKKAATRYHTSKPDFDNIAKIVADSLGVNPRKWGDAWGLYHDDAHIAESTVQKVYGYPVGVTVTVEELRESPSDANGGR